MLYLSPVAEDYRTNERVMPLYQIMAHCLDALAVLRRPHHPMDNAYAATNNPWDGRWTTLLAMCENLLPRGSGFDLHPTLCSTSTKVERIVIRGSYHNMNEYGSYDGWTDYRVTVRPSFRDGMSLSVMGGNNDFKDHVADVFNGVLREEHDMNKLLVPLIGGLVKVHG